MIIKIMLIVAASLIISACSGNANHQKTPKTTNASIQPLIPKLLLEKVVFSSDVDARKVKIECSMLETLSSSILDAAPTYKMPIAAYESSEAPSLGAYTLQATYVDVTPHRWVFPSIRPSSSATVTVQIVKDGSVLKSMQKTINSHLAFGACDRLEKIAVAGGRYIARWSSEQTYE